MPLLSIVRQLRMFGLTVLRLDVTMNICILPRAAWLAWSLCHDSARIRHMVEDVPNEFFRNVPPATVNTHTP